jgi:putative protein-disulfide isomerase
MIEEQKGSSLRCDLETGVCELPDQGLTSQYDTSLTSDKSIKVIYFTDPICSTCWGIEPQLRKMKLEYGKVLDVVYHMGGLLPDWSYNSGGISKPSDVAHHWDEVSAYYDMPIDGDVWLEDPLDSSYPPSIAFKAAELQDKEKSLIYLRALRELVFLEKKNIAKKENLLIAAEQAGLDVGQFLLDFDGKAKAFFEQDLNLAASLGVRGFPTLFFVDDQGKQERVYGFKPYSVYEAAISTMGIAKYKVDYSRDWEFLFANYPTLTTREFIELSGLSRGEGEQLLLKLAEAGKLEKRVTKNGLLWKLA